MQSSLHRIAAALVLLIVAQAVRSAEGAYVDDRDAIIARQKIRRELAAAMAEGHLSRMDQYRILLHAKESLPPQDLPGLQRTLDRLAGQSAANKRPRGLATEGGGLITQSMVRGLPPLAPEPARLKYDDPDAPRVEPTAFQEDSPGQLVPQPVPEEIIEEGETEECLPSCRPWGGGGSTFDFTATVDGFKSPIDVGGLNGNFGTRFGMNMGLPVSRRLGIGFQLGTNLIASDFQGTLYDGSHVRFQDLTSVGFFQRIPRGDGSIAWGFTYDWSFDYYYSTIKMGQWRVKLAWESDPWNEFGIWAAIPEHGAMAEFFDPSIGVQEFNFRPVTQGNIYWRHTWCNEASVMVQLGLAERPQLVVFAGEGRVPLTQRLGLIGGFTYMLPKAVDDSLNPSEEVWNVSVGVEFRPDGFRRGPAARFAPLLPVADNGTFAAREVFP